MNPTDQTADPLAELRALLAGEFPRWEAWRGVVAGMIYARRRKSSPPVVFRGYTAEALAGQIREYERRHQ
jgi:hypothetical protein